jgi:hypothetical protein
MKRISKTVYLSADEIEAHIRERENDALGLFPDTDEHRAIMREIAQLRVYADAKRWMAAPGLKSGR